MRPQRHERRERCVGRDHCSSLRRQHRYERCGRSRAARSKGASSRFEKVGQSGERDYYAATSNSARQVAATTIATSLRCARQAQATARVGVATQPGKGRLVRIYIPYMHAYHATPRTKTELLGEVGWRRRVGRGVALQPRGVQRRGQDRARRRRGAVGALTRPEERCNTSAYDTGPHGSRAPWAGRQG